MQASYFTARLTYDPETGVVFWKERPRSDFKSDHSWHVFLSRCAAKEAGHKSFDKGRRKCIQINGILPGSDENGILPESGQSEWASPSYLRS